MRLSASRENRLWAWLNKVKSQFKEKLHMCRVENSVMEGMADVEGCLRGDQFWIELKCEARPSDPKTKIKPKFRPAQGPWLKRRVRAGGNAFVLLQVGQGQSALRYMLPGDLVSSMQRGMTEQRLTELSVIDPKATAAEVVRTAATYDLF